MYQEHWQQANEEYVISKLKIFRIQARKPRMVVHYKNKLMLANRCISLHCSGWGAGGAYCTWVELLLWQGLHTWQKLHKH